MASEAAAALVLIDETEGRTAAKSLGLMVTGTVGVLVRARQAGRVTALKPILDRLMQQHGFRLSYELYETVLRAVGEQP